MSTIRLALIGCGSHSEGAHARPLAYFVAQHPGVVELTAACDMNLQRAGRFCREYGFARAYSDVEDMLDTEQPEAVVSVLPIEMIVEVGSVLLRRGIPCVLEKPPGRSLDEVNALAEVARQTGTPHLVSLNRRFNPYLSRAREWTEQVGPVRCIQGRMLRHARTEEDFLWGTGVHIVDAVCSLGGEITASYLRRLESSSSSTPWYLIMLEFASGCTGFIEIFPTTGFEDEVIELFGEGFRARVCTIGREGESVRCWKNGVLEVESIANPDAPLFLRNGSYEETVAFIRSLREGIPLRPSLADVLPALEVCGQSSNP